MKALYFLAAVGTLACSAAAAVLQVGPGKPLATIEAANAKAQSGDTILVHPAPHGQPYAKTAVLVRQKNLTFRAVPGNAAGYVTLSGKGFDYSGAGSTPRAIFQFNPDADGCTLDGFELTAAHNESHNGAGVRINGANRVAVRNCAIHGNDMGVMSNGDGGETRGVDQRFERCRIHHNGDLSQPGYNHNLYLGGESATLRFCEVSSSLTGHNVKSRAHYTRVEYCCIRDSANREFDLVDAVETTRPESHAVLLGNIIVKAPQCKGNRGVIHFGQDGGKGRDGALFLAFNTIVTPFASPVVELSAPGATAVLLGNLVSDGGRRQDNQVVAVARNGASLRGVTGGHNWFSGGFVSLAGARLDPATNVFKRAAFPLFVNPAQHDYHLAPQAFPTAATLLTADAIHLPQMPGVPKAKTEPPPAWQYRHPAGKEKRPAEKGLTRGAYARMPVSAQAAREGHDQSGITVALKPPEGKIVFGRPILLTAVVQNNRKTDVRIEGFDPVGGGCGWIQVHGATRRSGTATTTLDVERLTGKAVEGDRTFHFGDGADRDNSFLLKAGDSTKEYFDLLQTLDGAMTIDSPGRFRVLLVYKVQIEASAGFVDNYEDAPVWQGEARASPIEINVLPK